MKTIALRFADNIAPKDGTIEEHTRIIKSTGFVWYGKFGAKISEKVRDEILSGNDKRILLIHSGTMNRYWFYIDEISYKTPDLLKVPEYYHNKTEDIKTWFKVIRIEKADRGVMSHCIVVSSNSPLSTVSRFSMSPYFIIEYNEGG